MGLKVKIKKIYNNFKLDVDFTVNKELTVLFGPSGSGKSSTLRLIAGLSAPDEGEIILHKKELFCSYNKINLLPQSRQIGYILQNHALFPHLTIFQNILYGGTKLDKVERYKMANELIGKFKLENIADKFPEQISGGQQQQVVFARVIINKPQLLLLDEPFSALDSKTRAEIRTNLKNIHQELNIPIILVTHDIYEACSIADTMLIIADGKIVRKEIIPQFCNEFMAIGE